MLLPVTEKQISVLQNELAGLEATTRSNQIFSGGLKDPHTDELIIDYEGKVNVILDFYKELYTTDSSNGHLIQTMPGTATG